MKKKSKPQTFWAGFYDGRIDVREVDDGWGGWGEGKVNMPALFRSGARAREEYAQVRKVKIVRVR